MAQTDSDRTDMSKKRTYPEGIRFQLIAKAYLHRHICVEEWSLESPTRLPGWFELFQANKHMAATQLAVLHDPKVEKDLAQKLAEWFKPVRYGLRNGDGVNDLSLIHI